MTDRKKKLLIFHHDASLYGASLSLLTLLENEALQKAFKILVLLPYAGDMEDRLRYIGIDYKIIPFPRCIAFHARNPFQKAIKIIEYFRKAKKVMHHLLKTAEDFNPDLIYTNTSVVSLGFDLAKSLNIPHVWHVREFGDLDYNFQYLPLRLVVERKVKSSSHVIFVSNALRLHWIGANDKQYQVVYNGLISAGGNKPITKQVVSDRFRFGMLGAVMPGKGQDVAIEALALLKKHYPLVELHIWGGINNKPFQNKLESLISINNCTPNVFFRDFENDNDKIYERLDVVLNCSTNEGFGRTIVEAMSRGIPVIANASGGPLEIIDNGINGLFYHQTPASLYEKMEHLITNQRLYATLSVNAIEKAFSHFTIERYQREILNSFTELLKLNK